MLSLTQIHSQKSAELAIKLAEQGDVKSNVECAGEWIDDITANYIQQPDMAYSRPLVNALSDCAKQAVSIMNCADKAKWGHKPKDEKINTREAVKYVPGVVMLIVSLILFVLGDTTAATLSAISFASSVAITGFISLKPEIVASPVVNAEELALGLGRLFKEMDALLAESVYQTVTDAPRLTRGVMEGVQMLLEAEMTGDGDYALKSVPQIASALKKQGVTLEMYKPGANRDFDLLPSLSGGDTIRPAVRQGDKLLLRGQATVQISEQQSKGEKRESVF